jgi:hypothetical protein
VGEGHILEYFRKLCVSMPRMIEEVLANNVHMSKYGISVLTYVY